LSHVFYVAPNVPKGPSHVFVEFIPHDFAQCSLNCSHNFTVICQDNKTQSQTFGFLEIAEANQSAR